MSGSLLGIDANQRSREVAARILESYLPCSKRKAIAILALKTGHTGRYVREEIIDLLLDSGLIEENNSTLSLAEGSKGIDILGQRIITPKKKSTKQLTEEKALPEPTPEEIRATTEE